MLLAYLLMMRTRVRVRGAHGGRQRARGALGGLQRRAADDRCSASWRAASAGVAGTVEVGAVHGTANATLIAGYGYTGVLVAFIARHTRWR